jgi:hypothetical protein
MGLQQDGYTVKIMWRHPRPQPGCQLPNSQIIPAQGEFMVRDGKVANLFLQSTKIFIRKKT